MQYDKNPSFNSRGITLGSGGEMPVEIPSRRDSNPRSQRQFQEDWTLVTNGS